MDKRNNFLKKLFFKRAAIPKSPIVAENTSRSIEEELEQKDKLLQIQNEKLNDIAWLVSHKVRGPVASILGLSKLFNYNNFSDPDNAKILDGIHAAANELDTIIKEVVAKADKKDG